MTNNPDKHQKINEIPISSIVLCKKKLFYLLDDGFFKINLATERDGRSPRLFGRPTQIGFSVSIWYSVAVSIHNIFRRLQGSIRLQDDVSVGATAGRRRQDVAEE